MALHESRKGALAEWYAKAASEGEKGRHVIVTVGGLQLRSEREREVKGLRGDGGRGGGEVEEGAEEEESERRVGGEVFEEGEGEGGGERGGEGGEGGEEREGERARGGGGGVAEDVGRDERDQRRRWCVVPVRLRKHGTR